MLITGCLRAPLPTDPKRQTTSLSELNIFSFDLQDLNGKYVMIIMKKKLNSILTNDYEPIVLSFRVTLVAPICHIF